VTFPPGRARLATESILTEGPAVAAQSELLLLSDQRLSTRMVIGDVAPKKLTDGGITQSSKWLL
jgi:hypothetical protein